jgi:hypothetical protein
LLRVDSIDYNGFCPHITKPLMFFRVLNGNKRWNSIEEEIKNIRQMSFKGMAYGYSFLL